jgi:hypothetical protein
MFIDFTPNRFPALTICDIPAEVTYIGFGFGAFTTIDKLSADTHLTIRNKVHDKGQNFQSILIFLKRRSFLKIFPINKLKDYSDIKLINGKLAEIFLF